MGLDEFRETFGARLLLEFPLRAVIAVTRERGRWIVRLDGDALERALAGPVRGMPEYLRHRLVLDISFWTLNLAIAMRVGHALFPVGSTLFRFDHIAASGALALIALLLFIYGMVRSALGPPPVFEPVQATRENRVAPGWQ